MKKINIASFLTGFFLLGLLLFSSCSNPLSPSTGNSDPINNNIAPVKDWHGFTVDGTSLFSIKSGAVGIHYNTFTDIWGTYADVLELDPPSGHYIPGTMGMTFTIPVSGNYKLSMSVMAEKWPEDGLCIYWQKTSEYWDTIAGGPQKIQNVHEGEWFTVSTGDPAGVPLKKGDEIALLTRQNDNPAAFCYPDVGLNDAVIYIRNLKLEVNGSSVVDTTVASRRVSGVTVSPSEFDISAGQERALSFQVYPSDAVNKNVIWFSGNTNVATVDQNGLVKAVSAGNTVITVTTQDGGKTAVSNVTVYGAGVIEPKYLALTFDDGPDASATLRLLGYLKDAGVHATFFLMGDNVNANPDVARAILAGGHDIGNHSLTHRRDYFDETYSAYNPQSEYVYEQELLDDQDVIKKVTGTTPVFYRPPHLCTDENLRLAAESMGFAVIYATMFGDWTPGTSPEVIYERTVGQAYPWDIFDFHDCGENCENTVSAIPAILDNLINNEGYTIVSLSEMMALRKALYLDPGRIYEDFSNVPADPAFPANGVMVKATGITTSQTVINLKPGETLQLNAAVLPANTTHNKVYWYAEDEDEVSVDSNGLVSARSGGTTTIRAAADGQMATVTVTISGSS